MPTALLALLTTIGIAASLSGGEQEDDGATIVRRIRSTYASTTSAEIRFQQTGGGGGGSVNGTLLYSTRDRYRLELPKQTMVSDGSRVWTYTPDRKQVVVSRLARGSGRLTPGQILTSFPGTYATVLSGSSTVNGRSVWMIRCTPGSGPRIGDVERAVLYVDKETFRFQQIVVESTSLGTIRLRIVSANYRPTVDESLFSFTPPAGVRVVDLSR